MQKQIHRWLAFAGYFDKLWVELKLSLAPVLLLHLIVPIASKSIPLLDKHEQTDQGHEHCVNEIEHHYVAREVEDDLQYPDHIYRDAGEADAECDGSHVLGIWVEARLVEEGGALQRVKQANQDQNE